MHIFYVLCVFDAQEISFGGFSTDPDCSCWLSETGSRSSDQSIQNGLWSLFPVRRHWSQGGWALGCVGPEWNKSAQVIIRPFKLSLRNCLRNLKLFDKTIIQKVRKGKIKGIFCTQYKLNKIDSICGTGLITTNIHFDSYLLLFKKKKQKLQLCWGIYNRSECGRFWGFKIRNVKLNYLKDVHYSQNVHFIWAVKLIE